jgi:hypothetical protein
MSSMKYPYRDLGVPFDRNFRNDLNANFDDIEHDIRMIGGEAAQQALEAAEEANTQAIYAQTSGDYANDKGDYAAQQGDFAQTQGNYANEKGLYAQQQGDYAKAQGDYAKQVGDENKTRWLNPVATFADIATTYPNPQHGDTVMVTNDGENSGSVYRYENGQWNLTQKHNDLAIADVQNKIGILSTEINDARNDSSNNFTYSTLKERLDAMSAEIDLSHTEEIDASRLKDNNIPASKLRITEDANKIKLVHLSDEVLQAMAGTTPVNTTPGPNSVTTEKIAPEPVTNEKIANGTIERKKLKNTLYPVVNDDAIEINIKDKKVYIKKDVHAVHGTSWYYLSVTTQSSVDISAIYNSSTTYKLYMDKQDSNKLKFVNISVDVGENPILAYVCGDMLITANPNAIYLINANGQRKYIPKIQGFGYVYTSNAINVDTTNKKVTWDGNLQIIYANGSKYLSSAGETTYNDPNPTSYVRKVYLDLDTNQIKVAMFSDIIPGNNVTLFYFQGTGQSATTFDPFENYKRVKIDGYAYTDRNEGKGTPPPIQDFGYVYTKDAINVDTTNKKVTWSGNLNIIYGNGHYYLSSGGETTYNDSYPSSYVRKVYLDKAAGQIKVAMYSDVVPGDVITLFYFEGMGQNAKTFDPFENYKRVKIDGYTYSQRIEGQTTDTVFDWNTNKFVIPKELYLLTNVNYSIVANNFNYNKFTDNDRLMFELITPTKTTVFENTCEISSPIEIDVQTQIVGIYNSDMNNALAKDITLHFANPANKTQRSPVILCIGDSITQANVPFYIKFWLEKFGFTPTFIGTVNDQNDTYGYGIVGGTTPVLGEGRGGWRLTDFTGVTKRVDGSTFVMPGNPFWNPSTQQFDFTYYMTNNGFSHVDFVVIMLGTNDITGYHKYKTQENISSPTIDEVLAYMPTEFQKIIDSIHAYDPNIKIGLNPPPPAGKSDDFNIKATRYAEVMIANFDQTIPNVYCLASYLSNGKLSGKTYGSTFVKTPVDSLNNTFRTSVSGDVHDAGNNQILNALWSASWIINRSL